MPENSGLQIPTNIYFSSWGLKRPKILVCIAHIAQNYKANKMHLVPTLYDAPFKKCSFLADKSSCLPFIKCLAEQDVLGPKSVQPSI